MWDYVPPGHRKKPGEKEKKGDSPKKDSHYESEEEEGFGILGDCIAESIFGDDEGDLF
jgi:hypothetical protein